MSGKQTEAAFLYLDTGRISQVVGFGRWLTKFRGKVPHKFRDIHTYYCCSSSNYLKFLQYSLLPSVFAAENRTSVANMVTQYLLALKRRVEGEYMENIFAYLARSRTFTDSRSGVLNRVSTIHKV